MYLITPTLLNSFNYYFSFEGEDSGEGDDFKSAVEKEAAVRADFLRTLNREKSEPTPAMQAGIDFEDAIFQYCKGGEGEGVIREIGDVVKGGSWQMVMKMELGEFLLYARADVIKADTIFDIKRTSSYDIGKYQDSAQHRIELLCADIPKFSYLISDGRSWWREDYFKHDGLKQEIEQMIREFLCYLENDQEAKNLFYGKWAIFKEAA